MGWSRGNEPAFRVIEEHLPDLLGASRLRSRLQFGLRQIIIHISIRSGELKMIAHHSQFPLHATEQRYTQNNLATLDSKQKSPCPKFTRPLDIKWCAT